MPEEAHRRIRFDRNELSGAFGDIGTDFPLIVGMILIAKLDAASVLVMFGAMQLLTGLLYGLPMPAQPLKAMAVLVITQKLTGNILYGGGLAIGITMFVLAVTGLIDWLARAVPKSVVRGIQFGLGMQLALLAVRDYVPADGRSGYALAATAFVLTLFLLGNRRFPPAPLVILLGVAYAFTFKLDAGMLARSAGFHLPHLYRPSLADVLTGFVVLTLPQLPLSLGNSVLATRQIAADLFPQKPITVRKISLTYSLMNLINPFFGGVPTCHGSGGLAGHYAFGARTGGSVMIYGSIYLILGLFFSQGFQMAIQIFPKPILGVILAFEGLVLMRLVRDMAASKANFAVVLLVGLMCVGLPYGYVLGLVVGTAVAYLLNRQLTGLAQ
ncbi:MAG: putative sulfate/molybdate transporter [Candidatus Acidiferrales bacterium]